MIWILILLSVTTVIFLVAFINNGIKKDNEINRLDIQHKVYQDELRDKVHKTRGAANKLAKYYKRFYKKDVVIFDSSKKIMYVRVIDIKLKSDPYNEDDLTSHDIEFDVVRNNKTFSFKILDSNINNIMTKEEIDELGLCNKRKK